MYKLHNKYYISPKYKYAGFLGTAICVPMFSALLYATM